MHIGEGILSAPVLIGGAALSVAGAAVGLAKMRNEDIPRVGILSATFFVISLVNLPVGPTCVHLVGGGLAGLILCWRAFPAILVALVLQAVFFQFGGLTTLGVNTFCMAAPAVAVGLLFGPMIRKGGGQATVGGFLAGALAILGGAILVAIALVASSQDYIAPAGWELLAHSILMLVEGFVCVACVAFLRKVKPEILRLEK